MPPPRSRIEATLLHCYNPAENEDKVYAIWVENRGTDFYVCGGYGARKIKGMLKVDPKGSYPTLDQANTVKSNIIWKKEKKGYKDVECPRYLGSTPAAVKVNFFDFITPSRIDTSRIVGYSTGTTVNTAAPVSSPTPKRHTTPQVGGRVGRSIDL